MSGGSGQMARGQAAGRSPAEHHKRVRVPCAASSLRGAFVFVNDISRERLFCNIETEVQGKESN